MRILSIQAVEGRPDCKAVAIAKFDLQLTDDIRVFGLRLMRTPDGLRTYAPSINGGGRSTTFTPRLGDKITAAAFSALEGLQNAKFDAAA